MPAVILFQSSPVGGHRQGGLAQSHQDWDTHQLRKAPGPARGGKQQKGGNDNTLA